MHANGKLDTMRGIWKILHSERGHWKGGGRRRRGGSGARKEKCDKDLGTWSRNGIEKIIFEKFEIAKSREDIPASLKGIYFLLFYWKGIAL